MPRSIAASFRRNRVSRLSVPPSTMSAPWRMSRAVAEWASFETASMAISEFTDRRRSAAASAFGRSTSDSEYSDCRCRFVSSTTSGSTRRRWPTPARARRSEEILPSAPRPTTEARARDSARWPSAPISARTVCRRYRSGRPTARGTDGRLMTLSGRERSDRSARFVSGPPQRGSPIKRDRIRERREGPPASRFGALLEGEKSVVEVELVLLRDRVPVFFPFLEDRVEQRAHDLAELLNLRAKASEFLHHFLVGRRHSRPLNAAITAYVLIPLPSVLDANYRNGTVSDSCDFSGDVRGLDHVRRGPRGPALRGPGHPRDLGTDRALPLVRDRVLRDPGPLPAARGASRRSSRRRVRSRERRDEGRRSRPRASGAPSARRADSKDLCPATRAARDRPNRGLSRRPSLAPRSSVGGTV